MGEVKFYVCKKCGKIVGMIKGSACPTMCCGEAMEELIPGAVEGSGEKHIPVVTVEENIVKVNVGSVDHPMLPEHFINWVYLKTDKGGHRKNLEPGSAPYVEFALIDEKPLAVYEYCNIHGLWKADI